MKLCYIVYREENVMVYESQVLEYLKALKEKHLFSEIELIVFRHEKNLSKKKLVETRALKYIDHCKSFATLPIMSMIQLKLSAFSLRRYIDEKYSKDEQIAVICRGDLATYTGIKAFQKHRNSRILYDNRGLAYEESVMSYRGNIIHKINRTIKRKALNYSKTRVDMYNFVTNAMRDYFLNQYDYNPDIPYTIVPTLYHIETEDAIALNKVKELEKIEPNDFVITYVGSTAAWQSTQKLVETIALIGSEYASVRFFLLTNGDMPMLEKLNESIRRRIVVKTVPHSEMKYYLRISSIGIVIRDENIVNKVAAPTKIAEYLMCGNVILYQGSIGIIEDLKKICDHGQLVCMENGDEWIKQISPDGVGKRLVNQRVLDYFDMDKRQYETYNLIYQSFKSKKISDRRR